MPSSLPPYIQGWEKNVVKGRAEKGKRCLTKLPKGTTSSHPPSSQNLHHMIKFTREQKFQISKMQKLKFGCLVCTGITMLPRTHMRTEHILHTTRELRPYLPTVEVRHQSNETPVRQGVLYETNWVPQRA